MSQLRFSTVEIFQWEGMGDVGSSRYEPALLPPCPTIRVLSHSNCQEIHRWAPLHCAIYIGICLYESPQYCNERCMVDRVTGRCYYDNNGILANTICQWQGEHVQAPVYRMCVNTWRNTYAKYCRTSVVNSEGSVVHSFIWFYSPGDKVSMLTYTDPHKPLIKIIMLKPGVWSGDLQPQRKRMMLSFMMLYVLTEARRL